jgi:hypothetical protein
VWPPLLSTFPTGFTLDTQRYKDQVKAVLGSCVGTHSWIGGEFAPRFSGWNGRITVSFESVQATRDAMAMVRANHARLDLNTCPADTAFTLYTPAMCQRLLTERQHATSGSKNTHWSKQLVQRWLSKKKEDGQMPIQAAVLIRLA